MGASHAACGSMTSGRLGLKPLEECGGEHRPGPTGHSKIPGDLRRMNLKNMGKKKIKELEGLMAFCKKMQHQGPVDN
jgi:hypothetical protein